MILGRPSGFVGLLRDERPEVRFQAVIAFPRVCLSEVDIVAALHEALADADERVQHIALRMLEEVLTERAPELPIRARVESLLLKAAPRVRVAAALVLLRASLPEVQQVLLAAVDGRLRPLDPEDEAAAVEAVGELGLTEAVPALERRAFGAWFGLRRDRFAWHAQVSLARLGHERAAERILAELRSRHRDRRTLAVAAVGRARLRAAVPLLQAWSTDPARAEMDAVHESLRLLTPDPSPPATEDES